MDLLYNDDDIDDDRRTPLLAGKQDLHETCCLLSAGPRVVVVETDDEEGEGGEHNNHHHGHNNNGESGGEESEFTKLISKVGNGITPWGRTNSHSEEDDHYNNNHRHDHYDHDDRHHHYYSYRDHDHHLIVEERSHHHHHHNYEHDDDADPIVPILNDRGVKIHMKHSSYQYYSWFITIAATSCMLHLGYVVWGCFIMSDSWTSTTIQMSIQLYNNTSPTTTISAAVNTNNLAILLQDLNTINEHTISIFLWITSLAIPCIFIIMSPSWILYDYGIMVQKPKNQQHQHNHHHFHERHYHRHQQQSSRSGPNEGVINIPIHQFNKPRRILELIIRVAMIITFVFILLAIVMNQIQMNGTMTTISTITSAQSGWICYTFGVTCALTTIIVLRLPIAFNPTTKETMNNCNNNNYDNNNEVQPLATTTSSLIINTEEIGGANISEILNTSNSSVPPPHAFQLPWDSIKKKKKENDSPPTEENGTSMDIDNNEDPESNQVVPNSKDELIVREEETATASVTVTTTEAHGKDEPTMIPSSPSSAIEQERQQNQQTTTVMTNEDQEGQLEQRQTSPRPQQQTPTLVLPELSFLQLFFAYQIGLLSILFLIPAMYLPTFQLKFYGILSSLLSSNDIITVHMWNIPQLLFWQEQKENQFQLFWIGLIICTFLIILPLISQLLAVCVWLTRPCASDKNGINYSVCASVLEKCRNWLYTIHPACGGGIVFGIAMILTLQTLEQLSMLEGDANSSSNDGSDDGKNTTSFFLTTALGTNTASRSIWILNNQSIICKAVTAAIDESCLLVQGKILLGGILYLLQSVLLEIFIILTLKWN